MRRRGRRRAPCRSALRRDRIRVLVQPWSRRCCRHYLVQGARVGFVPARNWLLDRRRHRLQLRRSNGTSNPSVRSISTNKRKEAEMNLKPVIIASTLVFATSAFAQGVSNKTPGHQMQKSTTSTAPGASEYAPGHKMQNATKSSAPGASEYAPVLQTAGSTTKKRY